MLRATNRVLRCAQPTSRRLLRKTAILTQMLRPRNSATADECPGIYQYYSVFKELPISLNVHHAFLNVFGHCFQSVHLEDVYRRFLDACSITAFFCHIFDAYGYASIPGACLVCTHELGQPHRTKAKRTRAFLGYDF